MKDLFKNKELRNKIILIIGAMILVRVGSVIPIPGVNTEYMQALMQNSGFGFLNMLTGNSFSKMSFFALSISPYITASIIVQLMTIVIPRLEDLTKEGKTGKETIEKITMGVGITLAFIQSLCMAIGFGSRGLLNPYTWWMVVIMTIIWTAGAALLMVIGNLITKLDLGNGISYILVCNILSTFPGDVFTVYEMLMSGKIVPLQIVIGIMIFMIFIALCMVCILLATAEKRIPTTFSGKVNGYSNKQDLPIPLNTCGVMPIIFSGSIMSLPVLASSFFPNVGWLSIVASFCNQGQWFRKEALWFTLGIVIYILMTYYFTTFYLEVNFNPTELANNLKTQGAVIPGIRPGKPTADYIQEVSGKVAFVGTTFMLMIILLMDLVCNITGIGSLSIGGTSILICVSVIIESAKTIKTAAQAYKGRSYYVREGAAFKLLGVKR